MKCDYIDPIVADVQEQYADFRKAGKTREDAVSMIMDSYSSELADLEDSAIVMVGLVLALVKKKELYEGLATYALSAIGRLREVLEIGDMRAQILSKVESYIFDQSFWGPAAVYKRTKKYVTSWVKGDAFSHTITASSAKALGIEGWLVIFYKADEHVDEFGKTRHLMYVSLCPPEKLPNSSEQLAELGFLRMMKHDQGWDYLTQIIVNSRKEELGYKFTKIGNFSDMKLPEDRTIENPLTAMPLFGNLRGSDTYPAYEDQIIRIYKKQDR